MCLLSLLCWQVGDFDHDSADQRVATGPLQEVATGRKLDVVMSHFDLTIEINFFHHLLS